ncbi:sigma-54-dependent transcriptional regulator [Martelella alba]|uniref:Sigma-54-dependent Fis family transcriptional regulator n=1 Tax=Martelella alba TaxID=2590451 RepID=A0ABY2SNG1_9HYPH|nr:sigma-54 dependent transcriptional regulator [Martelella alba]TKI06605.1 sigma-54-dependent Fis family transcriptional regulator [Martelella alba]
MPLKDTTLLVVDDDDSHRLMLLTLLADWGYRVEGARDGADAVALCRSRPFDLLLMDVRMAGTDGITALREIKAYNPAIPILIMTAYSNTETAIQAIKAGAYDYLTKPLDFDLLQLTLKRVLDHVSLGNENKQLRNAMMPVLQGEQIIGHSPALRQLMEMLAVVAPSEATILITGESGSGKELIAKAIHANSQRRNGPYIAINCAAISESLLESELFGHEKGAFTGAEKQRDGRFAAADKGTLFLDEIGDMPLPMQVKLLRAIQEREIQRVGGDRTVKVDVRILAATNKDLEQEVAGGRFRQDLFYRLNVVALRLPPLRERVADIPLLAMHFLQKFAAKNGKTAKGFTPKAMDRLLKYDWPGNIRELENVVERSVVLMMGEYVSLQEFPPPLREGDNERTPLTADFSDMTLDEIEHAAIVNALEMAGGNKSEAARRLGITRKTLHSKIRRRETGE